MSDYIKFFDFCSGIGGGRLGLEKNGLKCVGHCEIDKVTAETYKRFYNDDRNFGDLTKVNTDDLPNFNFMIAGFPCQTFSIVGKREGFNDERGMIIYSLVEIMKKKNIDYFILENVKGLKTHNKGETLKIIKNLLNDAGYDTYIDILDSMNYGVPQMRQRLYIVGFKKSLKIKNFIFPKGSVKNYKFDDFLDAENEIEFDINNTTFQKYLNNKYNNNRYNNDDILSWNNIVIDWRQSDFRKYTEIFPTLRTGRHGILYVKNKKIKKLNGYESLLLQGFPIEIAKKVKEDDFFVNNKVLSQAGNAMTVNVIENIAKEMLTVI